MPRKTNKPKAKPLTKNQELLKLLAKKANDKIRVLEKKGVATPALKQAKQWLHDNTSRTRFSTNPAKLDYKEVQLELYRVNKFLNAKSSTVTGHLNTIKKREKTFISKGVKKENLESLYKFFHTKLYYKMLKTLDSDQIIDFVTDEKNSKVLDYDSLEEMSTKEKIATNKYFNKSVFDDIKKVEEEDKPLFNK